MHIKNAIFYNSITTKKINGTLFYCFEYFIFLKQFVPDIKYILFNADENDLKNFKSIFLEKYNFNNEYLNDIVIINRYTDFAKFKIENLIILDINSYNKIRNFTGTTKNVRIYSNGDHNYLNLKNNHIFYGIYDYQKFNKKERLKFYIDIHKKFKHTENKIFVTSSHPNVDFMLNSLNLNDNPDIFIKYANEHNKNMFSKINKIIYWHSNNIDKNNRAIVEAYIHGIELEVYYNDNLNDSIYERHQELLKNGLDSFKLDLSDSLIIDYLNDVKGQT